MNARALAVHHRRACPNSARGGAEFTWLEVESAAIGGCISPPRLYTNQAEADSHPLTMPRPACATAMLLTTSRQLLCTYLVYALLVGSDARQSIAQ